MADRASVSSQRVLRLFGCKFRDFTFVYFLRFANTRRPIDALEPIETFASRLYGSRTNCPPEVLHECLCFLDLSRVDLTTNDRTEGDFGSQLLRHGEGQSSLSSSGSTGQEDGTTGHLLRLDQINNNTACLSCQASGLVHRFKSLESKTSERQCCRVPHEQLPVQRNHLLTPPQCHLVVDQDP